METETIGRVRTEATIENLQDLWDIHRGLITPEKARRISVSDALGDAEATMLAMPARLIQQLGLRKSYAKRSISSAGSGQTTVYEAARLTIGDRHCTVDVMEVPDDVPILVGQVPLEMMDYVVDPQGRRLIGNPAHGGEHVLELY